jgi:Mannosyltransferase (PIG-V)
VAKRLRSDAAREALRAFVLSRAMVAVTAVLASRQLSPGASGNERLYDLPALTHPFGGAPLGRFADALLSPLARWDAAWFLQIAHSGYVGGGPLAADRRPAFFPLYPGLVRAVGGFGGSPGADLVAAYVVSLGAFLGALYLLHRLVELELGAVMARTTVLLVAFSPWTHFFSAPYSESLFLLLSVGAFYAARTECWAWAGVLAAAAAATRPTGLVLLLPLALLYLYGPGRQRRPLKPNAAFLLLVPLGVVLFSVHLSSAVGDPWAWVHAQETVGFNRAFTGPLDGVWQGARAAWEGVRGLFEATGRPAGLEKDTLPFLVLGLTAVAAVGLFRRLHSAYGAYLVAGLLPALSAPSANTPLLSIPRFATVLFPLWIWIAIVCGERRRAEVVAASAVLAGLFTAQFATWQFVV